MRTIKLIALLLLVSLSAAAQQNRVSASYELVKLQNTSIQPTISLNGASLGYGRFFAINKNKDLFLELGAKASYCFYGVKKGYVSAYDQVIEQDKLSLLQLSLPVNLSYRVALSPKVSLEPFVGLSLKINMLASYSSSYSDSSDPDEDYDNSYNWLDDVSVENSWSIGQLSSQFGLGVNISKVYLSVSYNYDLTPAAVDIRQGSLSFGAGFNF